MKKTVLTAAALILVLCQVNATQQKLEDCGKNPAGMQVVGYFAFTDDIETWPTLSDAPTNATELASYVGNFVMKPNKYFIPLYNTKDKSTVEDEGIGPVDGKQFRSKISGFIPGIGANRHEWAARALNANCVVIGINKLGQRRVVGSKENPAKCDVMKMTEGMTSEDARGLEYSFMSEMPVPAPFYTGTIPFNTSTDSTIIS